MNFKTNLFFFILLLIISCDRKIKISDNSMQIDDSLELYLNEAKETKLLKKQRYNSNEKALKIVSKQRNDSVKRINLLKIANQFYNLKDFEKYKIITFQTIKDAKESKDSIRLAKAYGYIGDYYGDNFVSDSSYYYYYQAGKLYKSLKEYSKFAKITLNKAIIQINEKDYVGCEKSVFEAIKYLKKTKKIELLYLSYNFLGIVYNELKEYDKSLEYHKKALTFSNNDLNLQITTLNNIGLIYQNQKNYKKSILYFNEGLIKIESNYLQTQSYGALLDNLAYSKFKSGDFTNIPNDFYTALQIRDSLKLISEIITSKLNLTEYYTFKKDTAKAFSFANSSYQLAKSNNLPKDILLSLKQLSIVNPKKIATYSEEYIKISDSLQLAERKMRNKLARIEFETEELTVEKKDLLIQQRNTIFIALSVLFLLSVGFLIRFQLLKNKALLHKQEQQKANEEVYQLLLNQQNKIESVRQVEKKRIAQELHDGILGKLFGTRMNLGILNNEKEDNQVKKRMFFIEELKGIEQEIREISHDLSSEKTAVFNNFVAMVTQFIENQKSVCKAEIEFFLDDNINWNEQENMLKINFYRILQECFQNINKHANATQVFIKFEKSKTSIILNVQDNGTGFDFLKKKKGIGLSNMIERTKDSNGIMNVDSNPGKGTELNFEMPQL